MGDPLGLGARQNCLELVLEIITQRQARIEGPFADRLRIDAQAQKSTMLGQEKRSLD